MVAVCSETNTGDERDLSKPINDLLKAAPTKATWHRARSAAHRRIAPLAAVRSLAVSYLFASEYEEPH